MAVATRWRWQLGRLLPLLAAPAALLVLVVAGSAAPSTQISTGQPYYLPYSTVTITGTGLTANAFYDIVVGRPDGSIVTGDGSATPGWDTVLADASGNFTYSYTLNSIDGTYAVDVYDSPSGGDGSAPTASTTFEEAIPQVSTDQPYYAPDSTVTITGAKFTANASYDVVVVRPDGSIVTGDGSFTPGWDTVIADASGSFTYSYILDGIDGTYIVNVYNSPWGGVGSGATPAASTSFEDAFVPGQNGHPTSGHQTDLKGRAGNVTLTFQQNATITCNGSTPTSFTMALDYAISGSSLPAGSKIVVYLSPNQGAKQQCRREHGGLH